MSQKKEESALAFLLANDSEGTIGQHDEELERYLRDPSIKEGENVYCGGQEMFIIIPHCPRLQSVISVFQLRPYLLKEFFRQLG